MRSTPNLHTHFHLPLLVEAFSQLGHLKIILHGTQVSDLPDLWHYSWGSIRFSSRKAYKQLSGPVTFIQPSSGFGSLPVRINITSFFGYS